MVVVVVAQVQSVLMPLQVLREQAAQEQLALLPAAALLMLEAGVH
jgi:hypothetical protein